MAEHSPVELLKALLRREIELFCRHLDPLWTEIAHIADTIRRNEWEAVFFGGTLRSLLISRLVHGRLGERRIYSGDDQFFRAIIDRVIEVNRVENPFPELCVVRSLVLARELGFSLGPRLIQYIAEHGPHLTAPVLEAVQQRHYGSVRVPGAGLAEWIMSIASSTASLSGQPPALQLHRLGQHLTSNEDVYPFLRTVERSVVSVTS